MKNERNSVNVVVEMNMADYKIDWQRAKEWSARMTAKGFLSPGVETDKWVQKATLGDGELLENYNGDLFAVVLVDGAYYNLEWNRVYYGGSSWSCWNVFLSKEKAQEYVDRMEESQWNRCWIQQIQRLE